MEGSRVAGKYFVSLVPVIDINVTTRAPLSKCSRRAVDVDAKFATGLKGKHPAEDRQAVVL